MRKLIPLLLLSLIAAPAADAAKRKKPPKGPTPKLVRSSISDVLDATYTESWMTEDQVTVKITRLQIGKAKRRKAGAGYYDPYIWAWPVKADVRITTCRTPDSCEVKRVGWWARDVLGGRTIFWFDRNTGSGSWKWAASSE